MKEIKARLSKTLTRHDRNYPDSVPAIIDDGLVARIKTLWTQKYANDRCDSIVSKVKLHNMAKGLLQLVENKVYSDKVNTAGSKLYKVNPVASGAQKKNSGVNGRDDRSGLLIIFITITIFNTLHYHQPYILLSLKERLFIYG